jgi:four helix bundle protein
MTPHELRERTKRFAIEIIRLSASLQRTYDAQAIRMQVVRAGTAVGANYRAVCRSRSNRDFVAKLGVVIEEVDETSYWLEILVDAEIVTASAVSALRREADELTRIFVASRVTARKNAKRTTERGTQNDEPGTLNREP